MEAAGIEPASQDASGRASTRVAEDFLLLPRPAAAVRPASSGNSPVVLTWTLRTGALQASLYWLRRYGRHRRGNPIHVTGLTCVRQREPSHYEWQLFLCTV